MAEKGLDVLVVNGSEADYADTRYFSNFWPLFERCGVAIAAPSANRSGSPSPTSAKHVKDDLDGKIDALIEF